MDASNAIASPPKKEPQRAAASFDYYIYCKTKIYTLFVNINTPSLTAEIARPFSMLLDNSGSSKFLRSFSRLGMF